MRNLITCLATASALACTNPHPAVQPISVARLGESWPKPIPIIHVLPWSIAPRQVLLDKGRDDGVYPGLNLLVKRSGRTIGRLRVATSFDDQADAEMLGKHFWPSERDEVVTSVPTFYVVGIVSSGGKSWLLVPINLGSQDGLVEGAAFQVFRGDRLIARMRVVNVFAEDAECRVIGRSSGIRPMDTVAAYIGPSHATMTMPPPPLSRW